MALLLVAVGALGGRALTRSGGGHTGRIALPDQLRSRLLFFAGPGNTEIVRADGTVVQSFPHTAAVGHLAPVTTSEHSAVFVVQGGGAYRVGPKVGAPAQRVGAADRVFPADGGDVGLQVGVGGADPGAPSFVEYMAADGTVPQPDTTSTAIPGDATAIARLITGLLVRTGDGHLQFAGGTPSLRLGPVRSIVGTFVATVAWTAGSGCASDGVSCPLHLSETGSGTERTVAPPAGFGGFAGGGAFSPDGTRLAAFVYTPTDTGPGVTLVLIDTGAGRTQIVGPVLRAGEPIGSAAWTPDGQWVFFSGLSGPMYAQQVGPQGSVSLPIPLPLPASYAFAPL